LLPARGKIEFMAQLAKEEGISARALEWTILTAARTGEVTSATWTEIDYSAKTWTIPASRMKAGKEHRIPLSPQALAVLDKLPREEGNPFCFIGGNAVSHIGELAMARLLRRLRADATAHGMRSSFRT
jgi:integrase